MKGPDHDAYERKALKLIESIAQGDQTLVALLVSRFEEGASEQKAVNAKAEAEADHR
jgi:hypothetical protein